MTTAAGGALLRTLDAYRPRTEGEAAAAARVRVVASAGDVWSRTSPLHVTGSALVLDPATSRVLLRWHPGLGRWLQVGGHGDPGEDDPWDVARREAREETGLGDLAPLAPFGHRPVQITIVAVPARAGTAGRAAEAAHEHADIRFLLATGRPGDIVAEDRSSPLRWTSLAEARAEVVEDNLLTLLHRAEEALAAATRR